MPPDEHPYADDPVILDSESLLRRIPPWHYVKKTGAEERIVSSAAFEDDEEDGSPMSTAREKLVSRVEDYLLPFPGFGVARLPVNAARTQRQRVTQVPSIEKQPEHTWVAGEKTHSARKGLRNAAPLIIEPQPRAP